jgi:hypothetical protein
MANFLPSWDHAYAATIAGLRCGADQFEKEWQDQTIRMVASPRKDVLGENHLVSRRWISGIANGFRNGR